MDLPQAPALFSETQIVCNSIKCMENIQSQTTINGSASTNISINALESQRCSILYIDDFQATPVQSRRKRSSSQDYTYGFAPKLYERIEEFFDGEGLHIISPPSGNSKKQTTLKECPDFQRLKSFSGNSVTSTQDSESNEDKTLVNMAMPTFLIKRTLSAIDTSESTKNALSGLLISRGIRSCVTSPPLRPGSLMIKSVKKGSFNKEEP